jgi:ribosomal protein S1
MQPSKEDFTALLNESFKVDTLAEGAVIKGTIVAIEKDLAVIDVGLKTEGRVPLKEFAGEIVTNLAQSARVGTVVGLVGFACPHWAS